MNAAFMEATTTNRSPEEKIRMCYEAIENINIEIEHQKRAKRQAA